MSQIDLIRAEIERRMKEYDGKTGDIETARRLTYLDVLSFLDTLESEKPTNLEEEINRYLEPIHTSDIQFEPFTQMTKCARHFAEWGYLRAAEKYNEIEYNRQRASGSSEKPNNHEGLDEAAKDYAILPMDVGEGKVCIDRKAQAAFKAGAEWMAKQGEVVEGTLGYGPHLQRPIIHLEGVPSFYDGHCQEVIVQIRKKEE